MLSDPWEVDKWFQRLKALDNLNHQRENKDLIENLPRDHIELVDGTDKFLFPRQVFR